MSKAEELLALLEKADQDEQGLPPVHKWQPERQDDIDMRIARDGTWYYQGSPIERHRMVKLFSTILLREGDDYFLVTPVEKLRIQVDDAPFVATLVEQIDDDGAPAIVFTTNIGERVIVDQVHALRVEIDAQSQQPRPYVHLRDGLDALISRSAMSPPCCTRSSRTLWLILQAEMSLDAIAVYA